MLNETVEGPGVGVTTGVGVGVTTGVGVGVTTGGGVGVGVTIGVGVGVGAGVGVVVVVGLSCQICPAVMTLPVEDGVFRKVGIVPDVLGAWKYLALESSRL